MSDVAVHQKVNYFQQAAVSGGLQLDIQRTATASKCSLKQGAEIDHRRRRMNWTAVAQFGLGRVLWERGVICCRDTRPLPPGGGRGGVLVPVISLNSSTDNSISARHSSSINILLPINENTIVALQTAVETAAPAVADLVQQSNATSQRNSY